MCEKRRSARKRATRLLEIFDVRAERRLGVVVNISLQGVMLKTETRIPDNKSFQLRMELPAAIGGKETLQFAADSRWCEPAADPETFWAGFRITQIDEDERSRIERLMREFLI